METQAVRTTRVGADTKLLETARFIVPVIRATTVGHMAGRDWFSIREPEGRKADS